MNPAKSVPVKGAGRCFPECGVGLSNSQKLHILAGGSFDNKRNDVPGQVCVYVNGVGAHSSWSYLRTLRFLLGRISQQMNPMVDELEKVYEEGDKVYMIGFSRGASAARKLASKLDKGLQGRFSGEKVPIEFVGCFDCVSMQLWKNAVRVFRRRGKMPEPKVVGEVRGRLPDNVRRARHLVALDDNRFATFAHFPPVLMDSEDDRVVEMWFPGVHGDVGGAYWNSGISDTVCKVMQELLEEAGLTFITPEEVHKDALKIPQAPEAEIDLSKLAIKPMSDDITHTSKSRLKNPSYRPVVTMTKGEIIEGGTVKVHVCALEHIKGLKGKNTPYDFNPELKEANVTIVDSKGKKLKAETEEFMKLIKGG